MAITTAQQADALFKASLGVSNPKPSNQFFEQPIKSAPVVLPSTIWAQESLIPNTAPVLTDQQTSGVVKKWVDLPLSLVAGATLAYSHANLNNIIPFNYGDGTSYNYTIKGNDNSSISFGTNDWVLQNNVLTFYAGIGGLSMPPKITFYQYVGTIGAPTPVTTYTHDQIPLSSTWTIVHGLNSFPNVVVIESGGSQVVGDIVYDSANQITLTFSAGITGKAYLS